MHTQLSMVRSAHSHIVLQKGQTARRDAIVVDKKVLWQTRERVLYTHGVVADTECMHGDPSLRRNGEHRVAFYLFAKSQGEFQKRKIQWKFDVFVLQVLHFFGLKKGQGLVWWWYRAPSSLHHCLVPLLLVRPPPSQRVTERNRFVSDVWILPQKRPKVSQLF